MCANDTAHLGDVFPLIGCRTLPLFQALQASLDFQVPLVSLGLLLKQSGLLSVSRQELWHQSCFKHHLVLTIDSRRRC